MYMRIRRLNHSIYQVQYHIVWGTKYRRKILKDYVKVELIKSLYKTQKHYPTLYFHSINTDQDHIHIQIEIPPKYSVAAIVQKLKVFSNIHLKQKFKFIREMEDGSVWSVGYYVSTIGLNEQMIKRYIRNQGEEDKGVNAAFEFS